MIELATATDDFEDLETLNTLICLYSGENTNEKSNKGENNQGIDTDVTVLPKTPFYKLSGMDSFLLHPFSFKLLRHSFGENIDEWPQELNLKIIRIESVSDITMETIKRHSFLAHILPLTQIHFLEVDVFDTIRDETKQLFRNEIIKRKKQRKVSRKKTVKPETLKKGSIKLDFEKELMQLKAKCGNNGQQLYFHAAKPPEYSREDCEDRFSTAAVSSIEPDKIKSFSRIVKANGYFPKLGSDKSVSLPKSSSVNDPLPKYTLTTTKSTTQVDNRKTESRRKRGKPILSTNTQRKYN